MPYDADLADQRARYGDSLLRRVPEQMARQEAFEGETAARVEEARLTRAAEQERIQAAEVSLFVKGSSEMLMKQSARRAEIEAKAAELAEQRRKAREEAQAWQAELNQRQVEEAERKLTLAERRKRKKDRGDIESADEGGDGGGEDQKPRRKRKAGAGGKKGRKVRSKSEIESSEEEVEGSASVSVKDEGGLDDEEMRASKAKNTLAMLKARVRYFSPSIDQSRS